MFSALYCPFNFIAVRLIGKVSDASVALRNSHTSEQQKITYSVVPDSKLLFIVATNSRAADTHQRLQGRRIHNQIAD